MSGTIQGQSAASAKQGSKDQAKGNIPGMDSLEDREQGASGVASGKMGSGGGS